MQESLSRISFFALVRLLERRHQHRVRVGELGPPKDEIVRFRTDPSLSFPARDIQEVKIPAPDDQDTKYQITANFLGLLGTVSPIPAFYSEQVVQHDEAESAQRAFFDMFDHRLLSLFYRAGMKYRYQFEFRDDCSDATSQRLLALAGFAFLSRPAVGIHPAIVLRYAGLLCHRPRSASVLQSALADFLSLPVVVVQCVPRWIKLHAPQRLSLGHRNAGLGLSAVLGNRARTCNSAFRIVVGPMPYGRFVEFLPTCPGLIQLIRFTKLFVPDSLEFDVELRVREEGIPPVIIHSAPQPAMGSRLGWTSWLITRNKRGASKGHRALVVPATARRKAA